MSNQQKIIFENEEDFLSSEINEPFDPKNVNIISKTLTIDLIIKRIKNNEINLFTDFQREDNIWNKIQQSRLIESLLIRFPLPAFYFDTSVDDNWLIVDGLQRLSVFRNFLVDKNLELTGLEYLTQFNNKSFDELPRDLQRRIEETQIITFLIQEGTPPDVKYNIFKRINTGGVVLEPQEIRHALNQGKPSDFVKKLAELPEFKRSTNYSIPTKRMKDRDLVNRFLAFYLFGFEKYEPELDAFLNKAMNKINELDNSKLDEIENNFIKALNLCFEIFNKYSFRKIDKNSKKSNPLNKALFDVVASTFSQLTENEIRILKDNSQRVKSDLISLLENPEFFKAISTSTGSNNSVLTRFAMFNKMINNIVSNNHDK